MPPSAPRGAGGAGRPAGSSRCTIRGTARRRARRGAGATGTTSASPCPEERVLGVHDPRREIAPGRRDLGSTHVPAGGPYDSRDPAVLQAQLAGARAAGLDGFLVSWWGRESEEGARPLAARSSPTPARPASAPGAVLRDRANSGAAAPCGRGGGPRSSLLDRHGERARLAPRRRRPRWSSSTRRTGCGPACGRGARPAPGGRAGASTSSPTRRAPSGWLGAARLAASASTNAFPGPQILGWDGRMARYRSGDAQLQESWLDDRSLC